jgi:hypothetical protein
MNLKGAELDDGDSTLYCVRNKEVSACDSVMHKSVGICTGERGYIASYLKKVPSLAAQSCIDAEIGMSILVLSGCGC